MDESIKRGISMLLLLLLSSSSFSSFVDFRLAKNGRQNTINEQKMNDNAFSFR